MGTAKYKLDEEYFNSIDSGRKAYWLGFLAADGYIHEMSQSKLRLVVELSLKDRSVLETFLCDLKSDVPIQERSNKSSFGSSSAFISITRFKFVKPLLDLNIKSPDFFSRIPDSFKRDFVRGLFEGDGCLHLESDNKRPGTKQYRWILASKNKDILTDIQVFLEHSCSLSKTKILYQNVWKLRYSGNIQVRRLNEFIYKSPDECIVNRKSI